MGRPAFPYISWSDTSGASGPRILGINPWITDFAAFNVWSRPVGLLACLDMLRGAGAQVALFDCLDPTWSDTQWPTPRKYGPGPYPKDTLPLPEALAFMDRRYSRYGLPRESVREALAALDPAPDMILVTSIMTYWYPGALDMLDIAGELWPDVPRILGGTYASLCTDHARAHAHADMVMQGCMESETNWPALWALLDLDAPFSLPTRGSAWPLICTVTHNTQSFSARAGVRSTVNTVPVAPCIPISIRANPKRSCKPSSPNTHAASATLPFTTMPCWSTRTGGCGLYSTPSPSMPRTCGCTRPMPCMCAVFQPKSANASSRPV